MSIPHNADGFVIGPDGFAESRADVLADFFAEHSDDPLEGDPADWPDCPWIDDDRYELGPDPDQLPLLRQVERTAWSRWLATRAEPQP